MSLRNITHTYSLNDYITKQNVRGFVYDPDVWTNEFINEITQNKQKYRDFIRFEVVENNGVRTSHIKLKLSSYDYITIGTKKFKKIIENIGLACVAGNAKKMWPYQPRIEGSTRSTSQLTIKDEQTLNHLVAGIQMIVQHNGVSSLNDNARVQLANHIYKHQNSSQKLYTNDIINLLKILDTLITYRPMIICLYYMSQQWNNPKIIFPNPRYMITSQPEKSKQQSISSILKHGMKSPHIKEHKVHTSIKEAGRKGGMQKVINKALTEPGSYKLKETGQILTHQNVQQYRDTADITAKKATQDPHVGNVIKVDPTTNKCVLPPGLNGLDINIDNYFANKDRVCVPKSRGGDKYYHQDRFEHYVSKQLSDIAAAPNDSETLNSYVELSNLMADQRAGVDNKNAIEQTVYQIDDLKLTNKYKSSKYV